MRVTQISTLFREAVLAVFNQRDRDQDGKMSFEEFSGQKTRSELAFEAIDKNGDGYVSRKGDHNLKLLNINIKLNPWIGMGSDPTISKFAPPLPIHRTEFKKICPSLTPEQCEAAFKKFDQDGTGRINYREFSAMMSRGKQEKK